MSRICLAVPKENLYNFEELYKAHPDKLDVLNEKSALSESADALIWITMTPVVMKYVTSIILKMMDKKERIVIIDGDRKIEIEARNAINILESFGFKLNVRTENSQTGDDNE